MAQGEVRKTGKKGRKIGRKLKPDEKTGLKLGEGRDGVKLCIGQARRIDFM